MLTLKDSKPLDICQHQHPDIIRIIDQDYNDPPFNTPMRRVYYCAHCGFLETCLDETYLGPAYLEHLKTSHTQHGVEVQFSQEAQRAVRESFEHAQLPIPPQDPPWIGQRVVLLEPMEADSEDPAIPSDSPGRILDLVEPHSRSNPSDDFLYYCRFGHGSRWAHVQVSRSRFQPQPIPAIDESLYRSFAQSVDATIARPSIQNTLYWFDHPQSEALREAYIDHYPTYRQPTHLARPVYTIPLPPPPSEGSGRLYLAQSILMHLGDPFACSGRKISHETFRIVAYAALLSATVIFIYQTEHVSTPKQLKWLSSLIHECLSVKPTILFCREEWFCQAKRHFIFPHEVRPLILAAD